MRSNRPEDPSRADSAFLRFVTPGFFQLLAVPLREGRDVSDSDTLDTRHVAVVSESFGKRYWPGQDVIGRRFKLASDEREIVGVVGDVRERGLEIDSEPQVYLPYQQVADGDLTWYSPKDLVVQTANGTALALPTIRRIIHEADPQLPITNVRKDGD